MADEQPCYQEGLFCRMMIYLFGTSWKTSFYATVAFAAGCADLVQQYLINVGAPPEVLRSATMLFGLLALLNAKDKNVTGGTVSSLK